MFLYNKSVKVVWLHKNKPILKSNILNIWDNKCNIYLLFWNKLVLVVFFQKVNCNSGLNKYLTLLSLDVHYIELYLFSLTQTHPLPLSISLSLSLKHSYHAHTLQQFRAELAAGGIWKSWGAVLEILVVG